jgi:hypothetical protein
MGLLHEGQVGSWNPLGQPLLGSQFPYLLLLERRVQGHKLHGGVRHLNVFSLRATFARVLTIHN